MTARRKTQLIDPDPPLSAAERAHINALIEPQLEALKAGTLKTFELDEVFEDIEKDIFG